MKPQPPSVVEFLVAQTATVGVAVWGWILTFVLCLWPYYWLVDHTYPRLPSGWVFAGVLVFAFVAARTVAKRLYRWHRSAMVNSLAERTMTVAEERAKMKFEQKYPELITYLR